MLAFLLLSREKIRPMGLIRRLHRSGTVLSLDEQEAILKYKLKKTKEDQSVKKDGEHNFFVMMDARINKERPYTDPAFDQDALIKFMGVSR